MTSVSYLNKCLTHVCFVPSTGQPASPRLFLRYWRSSVWSWLPVAPDSVCAWHSEAGEIHWQNKRSHCCNQVCRVYTQSSMILVCNICKCTHVYTITWSSHYNHHHTSYHITLCPTISVSTLLLDLASEYWLLRCPNLRAKVGWMRRLRMGFRWFQLPVCWVCRVSRSPRVRQLGRLGCQLVGP